MPAPRERGDGVEKRSGAQTRGAPALEGREMRKNLQGNSEGAASEEEEEVGTWEPRGRTLGKESMR